MSFMLLNTFLKSLKAILYKFREGKKTKVCVGKEPLKIV